MISRKSEYEREIVDKDAIVDRDAVEQAVQAAMASAGVGQLNLGSLGTSGQSVMEGEPITLAADPATAAVQQATGIDYTSPREQANILDEEGNLNLNFNFMGGGGTYQKVGKDSKGRTVYYDDGTGRYFMAFRDAYPGVQTFYTPEDGVNVIGGMEYGGKPVLLDDKGEPTLQLLGNKDIMSTVLDKIKTSGSTSPMSPMVEPEVTPMDSDIDRAVAAAVASGGEMPMQAADDPVMAAVETAVGNGQPTTDDTILEPDDMPIYLSYQGTDEGGDYMVANGKKTYLKDMPNLGKIADTDTATTDTGTPTQPDFMTQLNELIASMQAEQTAAAEAQAAAEAERQKQLTEMTQNYTIGQPAVGYNPYESGQYQNNPYGSAGAPDMGGITSIPVPAAYTPNPYLTGGMT